MLKNKDENGSIFSPSQISKFKYATQKYMTLKLKDMGISTCVGVYITALYREGNMTFKELTEHIGFDKANSSRVIKELESKSIIEKDLKEKQKKVKFCLTEKGISIAKQIELYIKEWHEVMFCDISADEKQVFRDVYSKVYKNITEFLVEKEKGGKDEKDI